MRNGPLRAGQPGAAQLVLTALGLIDTAVDRVNRPSTRRETDLHAVRVAIKRLRAILRLIRPAIGKSFFRRENAHLRGAGRRLANPRDTDVAARTLAALGRSLSAMRRPAFVAVKAGFERRPAPKTGLERAMRKAGRDLEITACRLERVPVREAGWDAVERGMRKIYHQARRRMRTALEDGCEASYHRWRIRVKDLYFQLQWLEPEPGKKAEHRIRCLKELEKALGENHDLAMLKSLLRKKPEAFGGCESVGEVIACLEKKSGKLKHKSRLLGEELFAREEMRD